MRAFKIIALVMFLAILAIGVLFVSSLGAANADSDEKKEFTIVSGDSTSQVAERLEKEGIIKNSFAFFVYMKLIDGKILPGVYEVSPASSASEIGWTIGSGKYKTEKLTIIEGWRVSQMADYLQEKKMKNMSDFFDKAQEFEGYLFPDTYEVRTDMTSDAFIKLMRDNYERKTAGLDIKPETIVLASIVEREAQSDSDRAPVAGVYVNRLKIGMRLEADPTVQYAKGSWKMITRADYRNTISPYNTYLNDGLPPGPICSPGLASIKAVLEPAQHDYIFFFHAKGQTHFSKTLAEHEAKVRQYF